MKKPYIRSKLHMIYISSNDVKHSVTKTFTILHYTSPYYTCQHFTSYHLTFTQLHFTTFSFGLTSLYFLRLHFTSLHLTTIVDDFYHTSIPFISPRL